MDLDVIIAQSYNLLFKNNAVLVLCIVGALIGAAGVSLLLPPLFSTLNNPINASSILSSLNFWIELIVVAVAFGLIQLFIGGSIISAAATGSDAEIGASIKRAASRYASLLGANINGGLLSVLSLTPSVVIFLLEMFGFFATDLLTVSFMSTAIAILFIFGCYMLLRLLLVGAACIVGGDSAIESVKNGWSVTKGNLWSLLALAIYISMIAGAFGGIAIGIDRIVGETFVGDFFVYFVGMFLSYPMTIALVLVYQKLSGSADVEAKTAAKT